MSLPPLTDKQLLEAYRWNYIYGAEWGGGGLGSDFIHEGLKVWEWKRSAVSSTSDTESFTWRTRASLCISACLCLFLVCWQLLVHLRFAVCLSARFHHFCLCEADPFVPSFFVSKPVLLLCGICKSCPGQCEHLSHFFYCQPYTLLWFSLFIIHSFSFLRLYAVWSRIRHKRTEMLQSFKTEWKLCCGQSEPELLFVIPVMLQFANFTKLKTFWQHLQIQLIILVWSFLLYIIIT